MNGCSLILEVKYHLVFWEESNQRSCTKLICYFPCCYIFASETSEAANHIWGKILIWPLWSMNYLFSQLVKDENVIWVETFSNFLRPLQLAGSTLHEFLKRRNLGAPHLPPFSFTRANSLKNKLVSHSSSTHLDLGVFFKINGPFLMINIDLFCIDIIVECNTKQRTCTSILKLIIWYCLQFPFMDVFNSRRPSMTLYTPPFEIFQDNIETPLRSHPQSVS